MLRESSLEDVAPAAVIALERAPRLAIPMPGFGEFGTSPKDAPPAVAEDAAPSGILS